MNVSAAMKDTVRPSKPETTAALHELLWRIESEYREMPGLCLTLAQACRLWTVPPPVAQRVLDNLVAGHVLRRSGDLYVRVE